jgi:dihydrofolate reductase
MIAAMANNRVIGADNDMPWHLPADLAHFKRTTLGKPVVMGRKTYQSIGKALPGRLNIVVSRDPEFSLDDAVVVNDCEHAVAAAKDVDELMVIGGGTIYKHFLPLCHRLYLTEIELNTTGDTYFPDYLAAANWKVVATESHQPDAKNGHAYRFITLERIHS